MTGKMTEGVWKYTDVGEVWVSMMTALVGYTGFVGSNLNAAGTFDAVYNSQNIEEAYGTSPDLLVYAGVRAEKYLANTAPKKDMECIRQAQENIAAINPKKLVLISTIDVFKVPKDVNENSVIDTVNLHAYGYNRYQLETWVRDHYEDALIVRLPGLFGMNIKKNFIYDYINVIPFMLKETKFEELAAADSEIRKYYRMQDNGFYKADVPEPNREELKDRFRRLGFSALNFTDSRSVYQFYNLGNLWKDIQTALEAGIRLWHPATEPVSAAAIYEYLTGEKFVNELDGTPADYDYRTIHDTVFRGRNGYVATKEQILKDIKSFVRKEAAR